MKHRHNNILHLYRFCGSSARNAEYSYIKITPQRAYATDGNMLAVVELEEPVSDETLYLHKDKARELTRRACWDENILRHTSIVDDYPEDDLLNSRFTALCYGETEPNRTVQPKYLKLVAVYIEKTQNKQSGLYGVDFRLTGDLRSPIIFEIGNFKAVLMPVTGFKK